MGVPNTFCCALSGKRVSQSRTAPEVVHTLCFGDVDRSFCTYLSVCMSVFGDVCSCLDVVCTRIDLCVCTLYIVNILYVHV